MEKVFGLAFAALMGAGLTLWNYFRFRSTEYLTKRAVGGGKSPCKWLVTWDHEQAVEWAQQIVEHPDRFALIDVTETGPAKTDEIIEVAVTDGRGQVLIDTLIRPVSQPVAPGATKLHGLSDDDLVGAPSFAEIARELGTHLSGRTWVFYNQEYVDRLIKNTCELYDVTLEERDTTDLLVYLAAYRGNWSAYDGRYELCPLPGGQFRALPDCRAMHTLIDKMAREESIDGIDPE